MGNNNHAVIIIAHGSPRPESNAEFVAFVEDIAKKNSGQIIVPAFLGSTTPLLEEAINQILKKAAQTHIQIIPYFLNQGNHVIKDIPDLLSQAQKKYPDIKFTLSDYVGKNPQMIELVSKMIQN